MTLEVHVARREDLASGVVSVSLVSATGESLPRWEPGAHIDLHLGPDMIRQYSLCGERNSDEYRIAVLRETDSRGGSHFVHDEMRVGQTYTISSPRNNFTLDSAASYVFIAGGIGITPVLPMIAQAASEGADWHLYYAGRARSSMAFLRELEPHGNRVSVLPKDENGFIDVNHVLAEPNDQSLVYCCGPARLVDAVHDVGAARWPAGAVRSERFSPKETDSAAESTAFDVECAVSNVRVRVDADHSILESIRGAGISVSSSCEEGTCGSCESVVLEGVPDHRDSILSDTEKESNDCMMICVSRSLTPQLTLEL